VPFDEDAIRKVLLDNSLKSDMVHPNGKGYAQVAAALQSVLHKAGAI
jgi:lysophospholipase L1-like esterase